MLEGKEVEIHQLKTSLKEKVAEVCNKYGRSHMLIIIVYR